MQKTPELLFHPLSGLAVTRLLDGSVELRSRREIMEIRVLAVDLFRIRIAHGRKFSPQPSWAVAKSSWGVVPAKIHASRRGISLQTSAGKLGMRLTDGSWKLLDKSGL